MAISLTYELVQEDEWGDVAGQAEELAHDHEPVPRLNGERHHQQLRQDEGGEGNGHDVDEFWLEEQHRPVHDDASCREGRGGGVRRSTLQHPHSKDSSWNQVYISQRHKISKAIELVV